MEELFKSLSESVSEECFKDIIGIVEEIISEVSDEWKEACSKKAQDNVEQANKFYRDSKELYRKYKDSRSGDKVLDAIALLNKHEKRKEKLEKAIDKHNKAKAEGKIVSKEDKEGGYNK